MGKLGDQILNLLEEEGPLTLKEIAERLNKSPKIIFRSLRRLFENGEIDSDPITRTYTVAKRKGKT
ncbi:Lrp/AsnC family transcriptional regulator [Candidatus Bathyarchaeota archaeon]|nr:MAG: Lrp/AsnC family transcriptional regulator [Candidatus Bathyarchaeota archaeon]